MSIEVILIAVFSQGFPSIYDTFSQWCLYTSSRFALKACCFLPLVPFLPAIADKPPPVDQRCSLGINVPHSVCCLFSNHFCPAFSISTSILKEQTKT